MIHMKKSIAILMSIIFILTISLSGCVSYDTDKDIRYQDIPGVDPNLISLDVYVPEIDLKNSDFYDHNPKLYEIAGKMIDKYERVYNGITMPMPVMIWVHGGGWRGGDKSGLDRQFDYKIPFFINEGWILISLNYRLSPAEIPNDPSDFDPDRIMYPVHNQDVAAAIAWVHDHIDEYGGNPDQISIMGHSAGASIVAAVGTNETFLKQHGLNLSVLKNVICLDTEGYDVLSQIENGTKGMSMMYMNAFGTDPAVWDAASPINNIEEGEVLPSFFVVTRGPDSRINISERFVSKVKTTGTTTQLIYTPLYTHRTVNKAVGNPMDVIITPALRKFLNMSSPLTTFSESRFSSYELTFNKDYYPGSFDSNLHYLGGSEIMHLTEHNGKLYAGNGYWNDYLFGLFAGAQILVKEGPDEPWRQEFSFNKLGRVSELESITFTTDRYGNILSEPVTLLMAAPQCLLKNGATTIWVRNDQNGQWIKTTIASNLSKEGASYVRLITDHVDEITGIHHVFAGIATSALYRGGYDSNVPGFIVWDPVPELYGTQRMISAAEANGDLYITVGTNGNPDDTDGGLFRRIDGSEPRWELIYEWPSPQQMGGEMRGLTAVLEPNGDNYEVLLGALASDASIYKIDPINNHSVTVELNYKVYFTNIWGDWTNNITLAAYNDMTPVILPSDEIVHFIGLWVNHPNGTTPPYNGGWYLIRHLNGSYDHGYIYDDEHLVKRGDSLRGVRTIIVSPFAEEESNVLYFGGYDAAGRFHHNTAWIYKGTFVENREE